MRRGNVMQTAINLGAVTVGGLEPTKIAAPLTGATLAEVRAQCQAVIADPAAAIAEWRLDYMTETVSDAAIFKAAQGMKMDLKAANKALLATVRTQAQGGNFSGDAEAYLKQYQLILRQELSDAIDLEYTMDHEVRRQILKASGLLSRPVILSYHDFERTPKLADLKELLQEMAALPAQLLKIAVQPRSRQDVLTIFEAADWAADHLQQPLAIMGMGNLGKITRVSGNIFPSALTFASVGQQLSAPGQLPTDFVAQALQTFKRN